MDDAPDLFGIARVDRAERDGGGMLDIGVATGAELNQRGDDCLALIGINRLYPRERVCGGRPIFVVAIPKIIEKPLNDPPSVLFTDIVMKRAKRLADRGRSMILGTIPGVGSSNAAAIPRTYQSGTGFSAAGGARVV